MRYEMSKRMMAASGFLISAILMTGVSVAGAEETLPTGAIKAGTMANQKLIDDTKDSALAQIIVKGCPQPSGMDFFVSELPTGETGSKHWKEIWVARGCSSDVRLVVTFTEDGQGGAYYVVK